MTDTYTIEWRRGTAAAWTSANPVLAAGEPGFETDTGGFKLGDGSTSWNSLAYFAGGSREGVHVVSTSGSTQTIPDVTTATMNLITLTANCTFTFPTAATGKSFSIKLIQDSTGSRTATWPGTVKWPGGVAPALTTTANKADELAFVCWDGTNWDGALTGANY